MAKAQSKPVEPSHAADRISVNEVFNLLRPRFESPHAARERLDSAICIDEVRVWCNDHDGVPVLIKPDHFASSFRAAIWESDGRWIAGIEAKWLPMLTGARGVWTMSRAEAENLLRREAQVKRGAAGRPPKIDPQQLLLDGVAVYLEKNALPCNKHGRQTIEEFSERVADRVDAREGEGAAPGITQLKKILGPLHDVFQSRK
jgi:hypothetical protein